MLLSRALSLALALTSQKPIQIIVPFAPGASADGAARIVANELGPRLNRQVVVENKAGAGGTLGLQMLAKSAPDGDTLGVGATGALLLNPNLPSKSRARPVARACARGQADRGRPRPGGESVDRPEIHQRHDRPLENDARRTDLWFDWNQFQPAPLRGTAQARDRRQSRPRSLSRQRARGGRCHCRTDSARI